MVYRGETPRPTSRHIREILPRILQDIGKVYKDRPDLILAAWPEIIGSKLASMTKAHSFINGILLVFVKNSTLYSLLVQHDRARILKNLRSKFPNTTIKSVVFRLE